MSKMEMEIGREYSYSYSSSRGFFFLSLSVNCSGVAGYICSSHTSISLFSL